MTDFMMNNTKAKPEQQARAAKRSDMGVRPWLLTGLVALTIGVFLLVVAIGSVQIPLDQVIRVLLGGEADSRAWTNIILKIRLPKALTALLAGAALSVSGLMMQTFFRNPLAGPFVLGISSGASLGVALVVLSVGTVGSALMAGFGFTGDLMLTVAATLGAAGTMLCVLIVARRVESGTTLLILGMMFGYMTSALVSLLLYFAVPERIQAYINWTFGTFGGVTWDQMPILAGGILIALGLAFTQAKSLNALLLGESYARSLGLNLRMARIAIISATGILAGIVTAFCGPIGFVGIAVPHLCRALFNTSDHRLLVPASAFMGGIVAMLAALIAEVPGNNLVLPLNAVTAFIGAPVVMVVILRQRNMARSFGA
nr:iron ABC transporter permease [Phototrophicus methaneseepsis]